MPEGTKREETAAARRIDLQFDDNRFAPILFGDQEKNLAYIGKRAGTDLSARGNKLTISGTSANVESTKQVLLLLWEKVKHDGALSGGEIEAALNSVLVPGQAPEYTPAFQKPALRTRRGAIVPRTPGQAAYMKLLDEHDLVFGLGPAGTGKTYLAVAQAVAMLKAGLVDKLVLSRPAVEAGERLGFLPGDVKEKVDPYLRPLYDALNDMLPAEEVARRLEKNEIEIAPLAFMRGRTLAHSFVILDEAQNTSPVQMKMFLTRLGEGARMVITGDLSQIDLPVGQKSGLADALAILEGTQGVAISQLTEHDVVRHPLVARIVQAYQRSTAPPAKASDRS